MQIVYKLLYDPLKRVLGGPMKVVACIEGFNWDIAYEKWQAEIDAAHELVR